MSTPESNRKRKQIGHSKIANGVVDGHKKLKVCVGGGGGFIGSHLAKRLHEEGHEVVVADWKRCQYFKEKEFCSKFHLVDLRNLDNCKKAVAGCDWVFNLAADMGGMGFIQSNHSVIMYNNTMISLNMVEASRYHKVKRLFYSSSACIYPENLQEEVDVPALREDMAWKGSPQDGYGMEKLYSEEIAKYYAHDFDMECRVARFHNIFGDHATWKGGREKAPAAFARKVAYAKDGDTIEMWGDGEQTRSYCYIDDCVEGVLRLMRSDVTECINLGSDEQISVNNLVKLCCSFDGKKINVKHIPGPEGVRGRNSDNTLIKKLLGWAPSISLAEGLEKTYKWIKAEIETEQKNGVFNDYSVSTVVKQSTSSLDSVGGSKKSKVKKQKKQLAAGKLTVCVCGGGGFIGSHLAKRLHEEGHYVMVADWKRCQYWKEEEFCSKFHLVDLRSLENCKKAIEDCDWVFSLAADMGGMGFIQSNHSVIMYNNTMISLNVVEACRYHGVKRIFYSSSACVYPENLQEEVDVPALREDMAWKGAPQDGYGMEKLYAEEIAKYYCHDFGMECRIARFHNIFGDHATWKGGREKAPAAFARKVAYAKSGATIEMWGDGEQTRSYCYIDECVEGILRLMRSDCKEALNLGSDEQISVNNLVKLCASFDGKKINVKHIPGPEGVRGRNSDNTLIKKYLGWAPSRPLSDGMEKIYRWIKGQIESEQKQGIFNDYSVSTVVQQSTSTLDSVGDVPGDVPDHKTSFKSLTMLEDLLGQMIPPAE